MRSNWLPLKTLSILLPVVALVAAAVPARAQDQRDASIGFYLQEAKKFPVCAQLEPPSCADSNIELTGELYTGYYAYLCVFSGNSQLGVAALQCGIEFDDSPRSGVDIFQWYLCANGIDYSQDDWGINSGAGTRITWDVTAGGCQREEPGGFGTGVTAVAGFFYVTAYSEDKLQVVPWRSTTGSTVPALQVGDCSTELPDGTPTTGIIYTLANDHAGSVGFSDDGSVTGDLPCIQRVQEETTWGTVKDLYNNR
jgi:hypothetical protein